MKEQKPLWAASKPNPLWAAKNREVDACANLYIEWLAFASDAEKVEQLRWLVSKLSLEEVCSQKNTLSHWIALKQQAQA